MKIAIIGLALIAFAPSVAAGWGASVEGGYENYLRDAFDQNRDNPATGSVFSRSINTDPSHVFDIASSYGVVEFSYTAKTATTATGIWLWTATWDGATICTWIVETTGTITNTGVYPYYGIYCDLTNAQLSAGSHTLAVSRSTQSGTPAAIDSETISYRMTRTDLLEENTVNDLIEFFNLLAPLILWVGVIIWAEITREPMIYALAAVAGVIVVVGLWAEIVSLRLLILGVILLTSARGILAAYDMKKENTKAEEA